MEISLNDRVYAINPRRIVAIESFKIDKCFRFYDVTHNSYNHRNPFSEDESNKYNHHIIIHMTDDFHIEYTVEDNSAYEKLRDNLINIVGG